MAATRTEPHYDVFISYRRGASDALALLLQIQLQKHGIAAFLDRDLQRGVFDDMLLHRIAEASTFLVILTPHALDRCSEEDDWLRKEVVQAISSKRTIIPLQVDFQFTSEVVKALDPAIRDLSRYQAVVYSLDYLENTIDRIVRIIEEDKVGQRTIPQENKALPLAIMAKDYSEPTKKKKGWWSIPVLFAKNSAVKLRPFSRRRVESNVQGNLPVSAVDSVHFSVTSHSVVLPGTTFVINVWTHSERQRKDVIRRAQEIAQGAEISAQSKGPVKVARGTVLAIQLHIDEFVIEDPEDMVLWEAEIANATFSVHVPKTASKGQHRGLVKVFVKGLEIAKIHFVVQVGRKISKQRRLRTNEKLHRTAFASYAGEDRDAVLARIQGIQKAAPNLDVFLDVLKLRSGDDWEKRLWKEIPSKDIFYLFWSEGASQSSWVEKEWRCALKARGLDFIDPVPLVSPQTVPPPPELASKHFDDWVLAFMRN